MSEVFHKLLDWISKNIEAHGLSAVFWGSIIEEIVAPIPSPAVMMGAGFVLLKEYDSVSISLAAEMGTIALIGALGALIGSFLMYLIGFYGGRPVIEKTQRFTGIKWKNIEKFQTKLESRKSDEITLIALRALPIMPSVLIALGSGVLRIKPIKYSICFYIGGVLRNIVFLILGWRIGEAYDAAAEGFDSAQNIFTILIGIAVVGIIAWIFLRKRKLEAKLNE